MREDLCDIKRYRIRLAMFCLLLIALLSFHGAGSGRSQSARTKRAGLEG
jgi:hypothetical protein